MEAMKDHTLTFGVKLGISTGILGVVIILLAVVGLRQLNSTEAMLDHTVDVNAHKVQLAGSLKAAESDMAVGQRGVIMFSFAKNAAAAATADALFQESSAKFQRTVAEIR